MKIKKLSENSTESILNSTESDLEWSVYYCIKELREKINELIDSVNENEKNRSEQMARIVDQLHSFQNRMADIEFELNNPEKKEPKILPCPFCLYDEIKIKTDDEGYHFVDCGSCLAQGPVIYEVEDAIKAWNLRK